jgi:hypothetical protein
MGLRRGKNNVFDRLRNKIKKYIISVGGVAHIVQVPYIHCLPMDIVLWAKHFSISKFVLCLLKHWRIFVTLTWTIRIRILNHTKIRWLPLMPAVKRIVVLRHYFLSIENCPTMLKNIFGINQHLLYKNFLHIQLQMLNACVKELEKVIVVFQQQKWNA